MPTTTGAAYDTSHPTATWLNPLPRCKRNAKPTTLPPHVPPLCCRTTSSTPLARGSSRLQHTSMLSDSAWGGAHAASMAIAWHATLLWSVKTRACSCKTYRYTAYYGNYCLVVLLAYVYWHAQLFSSLFPPPYTLHTPYTLPPPPQLQNGLASSSIGGIGAAYGGSLQISSSARVSAVNVMFLSNAAGQGGAVSVFADALFSAHNCVFEGNTADAGVWGRGG